MPVVTVASRPSRAPTAITPSPTTTSEDRPNCNGTSALPSDMEDGKVVGDIAANDLGVLLEVPSGELHGRWLPPDAARETTWLLVRTCPSVSMTKPDPVPEPSASLTRTVTTLGRVAAAICATLPSGLVVCPGTNAGRDR